MSSASELAARLSLDASGFKAEMVAAGTVSEKELNKIQRQVKFVNDVIRDMGKAQREAGAAASSELPAATRHMEGFSFASAGAKRELLVLGHELSQGNYKRFAGSIMVLGERTGAASLLFSAMGVAVIGVTAALALFAGAAFKGHKEQDAFNKSLVLTGNFAGMTSTSFAELAKSASGATGATLQSGKTALQALIDTGRIGHDAIDGATQATLNMERLTGNSADEIAKDFGKMGDDVQKWAWKHNEQYHYLSVAQFKHIKDLEDEGKLEAAQVENYRLLNERMNTVQTNLGLLEKTWQGVKDMAQKAWDAMKGVGRDDTTAEAIAKLQARMPSPQEDALFMRNHDARDIFTREQAIKKIRDEIAALQEKQKLEKQSAEITSSQAAKDQAAIDKIMNPPKAGKYDPLGAFQGSGAGQHEQQMKFLFSEIASYEEIAAAEAKAAEAAKKLGEEQEKAFQGWYTKYSEKELAKQMDPLEAMSIAAGKHLRDLGDQTKDAEQLVGKAFQGMEDALVGFVNTGKLSFTDLWKSMADEYLRNQIRMQEKKYLLDSAGNFDMTKVVGGVSSAWTALSGFFTAHANGLDYVPYNGYPAMLHEGERVLTKQDAVKASGGGSTTHFDFSGQVINVGQGVSRGEVAAAVQQGNAANEARIRRLLRNGNI